MPSDSDNSPTHLTSFPVAVISVLAILVLAGLLALLLKRDLSTASRNPEQMSKRSTLQQDAQRAATERKLRELDRRIGDLERSTSPTLNEALPPRDSGELQALEREFNVDLELLHQRLADLESGLRDTQAGIAPLVSSRRFDEALAEIGSATAGQDALLATMVDQLGRQRGRLDQLEQVFAEAPKPPHGELWNSLLQFMEYGETNFEPIRTTVKEKSRVGVRAFRSLASFPGSLSTTVMQDQGNRWCDAIMARTDSYVQAGSSYGRLRQGIERVLPATWSIGELQSQEFDEAAEVRDPTGTSAFLLGFGRSRRVGEPRYTVLIRFTSR